MTFRSRQAKHAAMNGWLPRGEQSSRVETINAFPIVGPVVPDVGVLIFTTS